jgi:D-amino-acid dehydrogenase
VSIKGLVRSGDAIEKVETDRGAVTADRYVVAAASHTPLLMRPLGIYVPICPVKGISVTVPVDGWEEPVRAGVIDLSRLFGLMHIGDRLRISGSAEITGYDTVPAPARGQAMINNVLQLFPGFAKCLEAGPPLVWAGLRGNSPDGPPILGRTPISNLFINAGHGPQGWSTSCGCARVVADVVSDRKPEIDLTGLTLDRF